MSVERAYEGKELELFAAAHNWKRYYASNIRRHLGKAVVEVGAGLGANTPYLIGPAQERWLCLEPDADLAAQIPATVAGEARRDIIQIRRGFLRDLSPDEIFDTILYIDVLEHIEDDAAELQEAAMHLAPGGKIIVLSPAQPGLYTEFDRAIGHYRRYTRKSLRACTPTGATLVELYALDSCGLMASVTNRLFLHQSIPTVRQIGFWDRCLVPISRMTDPIVFYSLGKSLVGVWQKAA
jgi:SAM-dependent methyltransferase